MLSLILHLVFWEARKGFIMKYLMLVSLILLCACGMSLRVVCDETDVYLEALENSIPGELSLYKSTIFGESVPSFNTFFEYVSSILKASTSYPKRMLFSILFIIIISCVYRCLSHSIKNEGVADVFDMICNASLSLCVFSITVSAFDVVEKYLSTVSDFSMALTPILGGVCISEGKINEGTVMGVGLSVFVSVCQSFMSGFLIPLLKVIYSFTIFTSFTGDTFDLSGILSFLKKLFSISLGFVTTLFLSVLSYQNIIATRSDMLLSKTVRFSLGNIIPVIGGSLAEALKTVSGAFTLIRASVGSVGVGVVLFITLSSVVMLIVDRLILSFLSGVCSLLGVKKQGRYLSDLSTFYASLSALVLCSSLMLIILLSIFSYTSSTL